MSEYVGLLTKTAGLSVEEARFFASPIRPTPPQTATTPSRQSRLPDAFARLAPSRQTDSAT